MSLKIIASIPEKGKLWFYNLLTLYTYHPLNYVENNIVNC